MHMSELSRRSIVASAAALPALAVPAVAVAAAAEPDPIFAAIERWRELDVALCAAMDAHARAQKEFGDKYGSWKPTDDPAQQAAYNAFVTATEEVQDAAGEAASAATEDIFNMVPTTLAGMRAKIDFAFSEDHVSMALVDSFDKEEVPRFMMTLYETACLLAVRS
jgi:hypothetical protein